MFRIIAIETLEPDEELRTLLKDTHGSNDEHVPERVEMYRYIMRVVKAGEVFYLSNDYEVKDHIVTKKEKATKYNIYRIGDEKDYPTVAFSAIVGENGQGKSSLLELMIRLINNVAFVCKEALGKDMRNRIRFTDELFLALYFEDESGIYRLEEHRYEFKLYKENFKKPIWKSTICVKEDKNGKTYSTKTSQTESIKTLSGLFYTIGVSYSSYALNPWNYLPECTFKTKKKGRTAEPSCWFDELFHKNDAYQTPIVLNPYRELGQIDYNNEQDLLLERIYEMIFDEGEMVKDILNGKQITKLKFNVSKDLRHFLRPNANSKYTSQAVIGILKSSELYGKKHKDAKLVPEEIGKRIMKMWNQVVGFDLMRSKDEEYRNDSDLAYTINYLIYKTIKIACKYQRFRPFKDCFTTELNANMQFVYIDKLYRDNTHITLKLRRCIAYLIFGFYNTKTGADGSKDLHIISVEDYRKELRDRLMDQDYYVNKLQSDYPVKLLYNKVNSKGEIVSANKTWHREELWPVPSIGVDFCLRDREHLTDTDPKYDIAYSSLSSGEKQMIAVLATVIYHVRNLASNWATEDRENVQHIRYRNICVIMDESELYSHPNMQMQFVQNIIRSLHGIDYKKNISRREPIQGIHFILATHSPFILSDMLKENVLCLQNGRPGADRIGNPFAANVYDILNNGFFMKEAIGAYAKEQIQEIIKVYHGEKTKEDKEKYERKKEEWAYVAESVGDPYLFNTLSAMLKELKNYWSQEKK